MRAREPVVDCRPMNERCAHLRFMLLAVCVVIAGCATPSNQSSEGIQRQRSGAFLERMSDRTLEAAHPVTLKAETITRILRGLVIHSGKQTERAFTETEAVAVSTSITTALSEATPAQQVGFRIVHSPERQTSAGSLYVYGLSLYLTLNEYRGQPVGPGSVVELSFIPQTALRTDSFVPAGRTGPDPRAMLVIDYALLARLPNALVNPAQSEAARQDTPPPGSQTGKAASSEDLRMELQSVKEELKELRRQMAEQEAEREKPKKKKKAP